jgi:hypothetical protein
MKERPPLAYFAQSFFRFVKEGYNDSGVSRAGLAAKHSGAWVSFRYMMAEADLDFFYEGDSLKVIPSLRVSGIEKKLEPLLIKVQRGSKGEVSSKTWISVYSPIEEELKDFIKENVPF